MRKPFRVAAIWSALALVGVVMAYLGANEADRNGQTSLATVLFLGGTGLAGLAFFAALFAVGDAAKLAQLLAGRETLARWRVSAADWDAFRTIDAARNAQHASLFNHFIVRSGTPAGGVEVLVGKRSLLIDGSFHTLEANGNPRLTDVSWLPSAIPCLEFTLHYLRVRGETAGLTAAVVRIPVPEEARREASRVLSHYNGRAETMRAVSTQRWPGVRAFILAALALGCIGAIAAAVHGDSGSSDVGIALGIAVVGAGLALLCVVAAVLVGFGLLRWPLRRTPAP